MTFDAWIGYVFNQPVPDQPGFDPWGEGYWDGPSPVVVEYLTRTFRECGSLLDRYSDEQVGQGLDFLINPSGSNYPFALKDVAVPVEDRVRCIAAIESVYRDCFAPRCHAGLCSLDEVRGRLNGVCYMWWDVFPVIGMARYHPEDPGSPALDQAGLRVLSNCLLLNSEACIESALHGLGHMYIYCPEVTGIVDAFLARNPSLSEGLRSYAQAARLGRVL